MVVGENGLFFSAGENTQAEVKANNMTLLFGYQPDQHWNFYAGLAYQSFKASVQTRGVSYGLDNALGHYNAVMQQDESIGWVAGLAYQIPDIAFRAALTYRSEIKHSLATHEYGQSNILMLNGFDDPIFDTVTQNQVITPQSVNLDLQTGIAKGTLLFLNSRWVNWANFSIKPKFFGEVADMLGEAHATPDNLNGFDLLKYKDNQFSTTLGIAHKFNEQWAGNTSIGWDSGTGQYASTLSPTKGYWSYGIGLQYSPQTHYFIAGGLRYIQIGDAQAQSASSYGSNNSIADFKHNDSWAYGLKVGYRF
jgi:long-chain fatty acid transport protein